MPTKPLQKADRRLLEALGKKVEKMILVDMGYSSLDAFSLEFSDEITKATLYQVCRGERDMKISTLLGLSRALGVPLGVLLAGL